MVPLRQDGRAARPGAPRDRERKAPSSRKIEAMAHQTRPFIGVNADFLPPNKLHHAHLRLAAGYVDAVYAAGGMPLVLPPVCKEKELDAFLDRVDGFVLS